MNSTRILHGLGLNFNNLTERGSATKPRDILSNFAGDILGGSINLEDKYDRITEMRGNVVEV